VTEWLDNTWLRLNQIRISGRLPHALLVVGVEGIGKRTLAGRLAASLLCDEPAADGQSCGRCPACGWLQAGTHPDLLQVLPAEEGKAIRVDQIRALCSELAMTSHAGRHKVAIIHPADAMNANAANSLLKTLEEPTDRTLLMLLSALPGKLPATIRSRCQQIRLVLPSPAGAQRWLESRGVAAETATQCIQMAGGAPLKALELARSDLFELRSQRLDELSRVFAGRLDPVRLAGDWASTHEVETLQWWLQWLRQLVAWRLAATAPAEAQVAQKLQNVAETVDSRQMCQMVDGVAGALDSIGTGLNRQLILEDLLIGWAAAASAISQHDRAGNG
jgi:DNA polymerase-3 subunit delta'